MLTPILSHSFTSKYITFYVKQDELKTLLEDPLKEFGNICTVVCTPSGAGVQISATANDTEFKTAIKSLAEVWAVKNYVEKNRRCLVEDLEQDDDVVNPLDDPLVQLYDKILGCLK